MENCYLKGLLGQAPRTATGTNWLCFLQNKANFQKSQVNVKLNISRDYEKKIEMDIW
jgi:hypothetical protein